MRWHGFPKILILAVSFAAGAVLPSLVGCSPGSSTIGHVIDAMHGNSLYLDAESAKEFERFDTIYTRFAKAGDARDEQLRHFGDAFKRVKADYVNPIASSKLIDLAIQGIDEMDPKPEPGATDPAVLVEAALDKMLTSLDPHSGYLNPDEFREIGVTTKGEFGGLGIQVTMEDGLVKVIAPIEDTPADRAGIEAGDLITHLDGDPVKGITLSDAVKRMRGRPGTQIVLTVKRGEMAPFDVGIIRDIIEVKAVRWRVEGDVGYIRVTRFNAKAEDGVKVAMEDIRRQLGPRLKGVVLDLRNNPGGLLDQSVAIGDEFLESGRVVSVRGRDPRDERLYDATRGDVTGGLPMVVLINGGSASASEIVAAALQDHRRAVIMGGRSFGKGSVQTIVPLPVEGGLRLTTQLYYTPMERAIQALGVEPDIEITPAEKPDEKHRAQREVDLEGAIPAQAQIVHRTRARLNEMDCPAIEVEKQDKPDRVLGCALDFLSAGSMSAFLDRHRAAEQL